MEKNEVSQRNHPLETESIGKLILKYSLPAVARSLVNSLYNIVDQIFVGNSIGELGNAATNVAFPIVLVVAALAMTFGVGGASSFSLSLGQRKEQKAKSVAGNSMTLLLLTGVIVGGITVLFLRPLLIAFGGRGQTLEYAMEYTRIIAVGTPLAMLGTGASQLIRADGSPRYAMLATLSGTLLNCILAPVLIYGFDMGMSGAAYATVIGQFVSAVLILFYFRSFKSVKLTAGDYRLKLSSVLEIIRIGIASGAMQFASTLISIVLNNVLGYYGELSQYGRDIPLACVGIITKVCALFDGVALGIAQSMQPIIGYNYGAGNFDRIKVTFRKVAGIIVCISTVAFLSFQIFPRQIIAIFGSGDALYFDFAVRYFSNLPVLYFYCRAAAAVYAILFLHRERRYGAVCAASPTDASAAAGGSHSPDLLGNGRRSMGRIGGRWDVASIITHEYPWEQLPDAVETASRVDEALNVVIRY